MVRKRKEDFSNFVRSVLQNSMLTGIPQIAGAANAPKKITRALVFLVCVGGFIYQSLSFMDMYYKYETVIDIKTENPYFIQVPGITFCNYNGIMMNKLCHPTSQFFNICKDIADSKNIDFCKCYPTRYCNENGTTIHKMLPKNGEFYKLYQKDYDVLKVFLQTKEEMVADAWYLGATPEDYVFIQDVKNKSHSYLSYSSKIEAIPSCYTINSLLGLPDEELGFKLLSRATFILFLKADDAEYYHETTTASHHIAFHDNKMVANPFHSGYTALPAQETTFWMKKVIKNLLPPPYETNCKDYESEWKARGGYGPIDEKSCIEECRLNASLEIQGCVAGFFVLIPNNFVRCLVEEPKQETIYAAMECQKKNCRPACYEETYSVTKEVSPLSLFDCITGNQFKDLSQINVKFDGMETTIYTYSPKYQNIETFSYVGGYIGMWLGISLVAVFDFLETLVMLCRYPVRRYLTYRARKDRVRRMKNPVQHLRTL